MTALAETHEYEAETVNQDAEIPPGDFYVTCRDGRKTAFLLGPYDYIKARDNVKRGLELATDADWRAWFYEFGISRLPIGTRCRTVFGV